MEMRHFPIQAAPANVRDIFCKAGSAEASWEWFATMAEAALDPNQTIEIVALLDADECCKAALSLISRGGELRAATSAYTTEFRPLGDPESAFQLGLVLGKQVHKLQLDSLDINEPATDALIKGLQAGGLTLAKYRQFANWYGEITGLEEFWKGKSSRLRSLVRRKSSQLEKAGRLCFEEIDLREDCSRGVDLYENLYAKSWKAHEKHPLFAPTLLRRLGAIGVARLGIAYIDSEPAAAQIWLIHSPRATIFKLAHDRAFEKHSPGTLLTKWLLEQFVKKDGIRLVDFGRGDDAYKKEWLGERQFRHGLIAADPWSMVGLVSLITDVWPTGIAASAPIRYFKEVTGRLGRERKGAG